MTCISPCLQIFCDLLPPICVSFLDLHLFYVMNLHKFVMLFAQCSITYYLIAFLFCTQDGCWHDKKIGDQHMLIMNVLLNYFLSIPLIILHVSVLQYYDLLYHHVTIGNPLRFPWITYSVELTWLVGAGYEIWFMKTVLATAKRLCKVAISFNPYCWQH